MPRCALMAACAAALLVAQTARAGVSVTGYNCFPLPAGAFTLVNHGNEHYSITLKSLYSPWADSIYEIRPTAPGAIIDNLLITIDGPVAGSPVIIRIYPKCGDESTLIRSVHNILELGTAETLLNIVRVEEDIGRIEIEAIGDMYCGRDLIGPIISTTPDNTIRGINAIQAQRHVLGDLIAMEGRVGYITAHTGHIGTPTQPILIRAKHDILKLDARLGDIYADINSHVNDGPGLMTFLNAGTFQGRIDTMGLKQGLKWIGNITVRDRMVGEVIFRRGFSGPEYINLPVGQTLGQFIFNADNVPNANWTSAVNFKNGPTTQFVLNGPNYVQTPAQLGGGSLALTPYALQAAACVPAPNSTLIESACGGTPSVRLRFYGPIVVSGPAPLSITRRPAGSSAGFAIVPPTNFTYAVGPQDPNVLTITPVSGASIGFNPGFEYRITPQAALVCAVATGSPPVKDFEYRMTTIAGATCPADLNCSGTVNGLDLAILLGAWGPCMSCAADLNGSGSVNGLDLGILLGAWGPCGSGSK